MENRIRKHSHPPKVFCEYHPIISGKQKLRVRLVQYQHPMIGTSVPLLDIREWIEGKLLPNKKLWTGFSSNGVALDKKAVGELKLMIEDIHKRMCELEEDAVET